MNLFKPLVLRDSVEIETTPEKIWGFFYHLDRNYKSWHPTEHVVFKWTGEPMEIGSKYYAEEYLNGRIHKFYGTISEAIPYKKIVFKHGFPISLIGGGFEIQLERKGSRTIFTAVNHIKAEKIFRFLAKFSEYRTLENMIEIGRKHTIEEGENLKRILENKNL